MLRRLVAVIPAVALVAACSSGSDSGIQEVRDPQGEMYFQVPEDWSVLTGDALAGATEIPFVSQNPDLALPVFSRVVFHGAGTDTGLPGINTANLDYPAGSAVVRTIPAALRDHISRYWLAELVTPYHTQPVAQEVIKEDISLGEGFDGVKILVGYNDAQTETDAVVFLISVTDPEVQFMYSIAVGCSLACFNTHAEAMVDVIDSWLVNTR